jgi:hypothetical protein
MMFRQAMEGLMTAGTIAILAGITSAFLLFAVVLMWADRYSHQNRSQAAQPKPAPQREPDRLAA